MQRPITVHFPTDRGRIAAERRAIARIPIPAATPTAISSRSDSDRYRPRRLSSDSGAIPPLSRNQVWPQATDTPTATAAGSVDTPLMINCQNCRRRARTPEDDP